MADGLVSEITVRLNVDTSSVEDSVAKSAQSLYALNQIINFLEPIKDAIIDFGTESVRVFAEFDDTLKNVQATLGATGAEGEEQLGGLRDLAIELGADTKYTATEVSDAFAEMSRAGWDYEQILEGAKGVTDLAIISQMSFAETTDYLIGIVNAFSYEASEATDVVDIMAQAAVNSNLEFGDLTVALRQTGSYAGALGYSLEDVTVQLMLMSQAGMKGTKAGTSLRRILTRLYNPTEDAAAILKDWGITMTDAEGAARPLQDVINDLRIKFAELTTEQKASSATALAGQTGQEGLMVLMEASAEQATEFAASLDTASGAAEQMTDIMKEGAGYQIEELASSFENIKIVMGEVIFDALEPMIHSLKDLFDWFTELSPEVHKFIAIFGGAVAIITSFGVALVTLKKGIEIFGLIKGIMLGAGGAAGIGGVGGAGVLGALGSTVAIVAPYLLAGAAIIGGTYLIVDAINDAKTSVDLFADVVTSTSVDIEAASLGLSEAVTSTTVAIDEETKKSISAYLALDTEATNSLNKLAWGNTVISEQIKNDMEAKFDTMADSIIASYEKQRVDSLASSTAMFGELSALTETEEAGILNSINGYYIQRKDTVDTYMEEINLILEEAYKEQRELTEEEYSTITRLENAMREEAVKAMSKNELEAKTILTRMKQDRENITAESMAAYIKEINASRDGAIAAANTEYESTIATIIKLRDESGVISAEQADKMIEEATRQKEEVIASAENTRLGVLENMHQMNDDVFHDVDKSTGEIVGLWQKVLGWWDNWNPERKTFVASIKVGETAVGSSSQKGGSYTYASGASYLNFDQIATDS